MKSTERDGLSVLGVGAAACVACCAGPILAFFGGVSLAGLVSTLLIGSIGVAIAAVGGVGFLVVRGRRGAVACTPVAPGPVAVAPPTRTPS